MDKSETSILSEGRQGPMRRLMRVATALTSAERYLLAVGVIAMTLVVFWGTVVRYTPISARFAWTEEIARLLLIWAVFLGAAMLERGGGHFSVDIFVRHIGRRQRVAMATAADIFSLSIMILVLRESILFTLLEMRAETPTLAWPAGIFPLALVCGSALMIAYIGARLVLKFRRQAWA